MNDALKFLLAAKRAEIHALTQLAQSCELVDELGKLVHMLQRERGAATLFIASGGSRFLEQLTQYSTDAALIEARVRARFVGLDVDGIRSVGSVRLFSRIAYVLHGLGSLPVLRARVQSLALTADENTAAMSRLIAGLLAVVFEAADAAAEPQVSRALVALFNFMQGKELAGQERAAGVMRFASGQSDAARQQQLSHLIEAQERCFDVFADFAAAEHLLHWQNALAPGELAELERLRRRAASPGAGGEATADPSERWFDVTTRRIDAMKRIEDELTARLAQLCEERVVAAEADLRNHKAILATLAGLDTEAAAGFAPPPAALEGEAMARGAMTPQLGRSVLDLVQAQSQRIQQMADELSAARAALHERKVIERAKGLLMSHRSLSEDQAFRLLRQTAMDQGRRLVDVAESVLALGRLLGGDTLAGKSAEAPRGAP